MLAVEVDNLTKRFGDFCAVDHLNFNVAEGEIFGLLGPNGAGKSTLIRMLTTLVPPTEGTARVNGFDVVKNANKVRQSIGVIPQAMTSDLDLSAEENMSIFAKLYGIPREKRRRNIIRELLRAVDLEQWTDKPVKMFSGGMRRRLEIARGLVHEPKLFFLDEPTTGLDPVSRVAVWDMLAKLKRERELTILVTTHYMDEADKLCDRIAIVDHGKLVALDSPLKLKASVPGKNIIEVSFSKVPPAGRRRSRRCPRWQRSRKQRACFRISTNNGPRTHGGVDGSGAEGGPDAFFALRSEHDAGRCFCALHRASIARHVAGRHLQQRVHVRAEKLMNRILAIIERDLRRFRRSPTLVIVSMVMPLVQLVVLGYAFGGKVKHLEVGILDQDHGVPAIKLREMAQAVAVNAQTFDTTYYNDQAVALRDLRHGKINGLITIPPNFSRKVLAGDNPRIALIEDNTDQFAVSALEGSLDQMLGAYNLPHVPARLSANATFSVVEVYPYVPYIQYLLPGTIVLAIFVSAMIGGGIIFIDDKARGLHEGYLVTPIRKFELIVGFNMAGAVKAVLTGLVLVIFGSIIAGIPDPLDLGAHGADDGSGGGDGAGAHQHDVSADGARDRSAGAAGDFWGLKHRAVLPQRRGVSDAGFSAMDESHQRSGPVHICRAWVQTIGAQKYGAGCDRARHCVSGGLHDHRNGGGDTDVPANAVGTG